MSRTRGRYAVIVATTPPDWRPCSCASLPAQILGTRFLCRAVPARDAAAAARTFNRGIVQNQKWGEWALVVSPTRFFTDHSDTNQPDRLIHLEA